MLLKILAHHQEPADTDLLEAVMDRLDSIIGLGPLGSALIFAAILVSIPAGLLGLYAWQRRRTNT